eukprot:2757020-Prorocentrum_lima.AAC.1
MIPAGHAALGGRRIPPPLSSQRLGEWGSPRSTAASAVPAALPAAMVVGNKHVVVLLTPWSLT